MCGVATHAHTPESTSCAPHIYVILIVIPDLLSSPIACSHTRVRVLRATFLVFVCVCVCVHATEMCIAAH